MHARVALIHCLPIPRNRLVSALTSIVLEVCVRFAYFAFWGLLLSHL